MTAIPVTVLTGFLGSGKTTLLAALLRSPALARTAVIINEFGEVGLDHDLVAASDESFVTLQTGCLCCSIRGDLVLTLQDLLARRADGTVMAFERIVIETSGLADPAPILQALMTEAALGRAAGVGGRRHDGRCRHGADDARPAAGGGQAGRCRRPVDFDEDGFGRRASDGLAATIADTQSIRARHCRRARDDRSG